MISFVGTIEKGSGQAGAAFHLPTANLALERLPEGVRPGVYASQAKLVGSVYQAITFIGQAHLLPGKPWRLETHLFGASGYWFGQQLEVTLLHHVREPIPFQSEPEAADAIANDIDAVRAYFQKLT